MEIFLLDSLEESGKANPFRAKQTGCKNAWHDEKNTF
jgi:hypothetical protein